jgi:uncharacterized protein (DUF1800 family)
MNKLEGLRTLIRAAIVESTNMALADERDIRRRIDMVKSWINDPATPRSQRDQHNVQPSKTTQARLRLRLTTLHSSIQCRTRVALAICARLYNCFMKKVSTLLAGLRYFSIICNSYFNILLSR